MVKRITARSSSGSKEQEMSGRTALGERRQQRRSRSVAASEAAPLLHGLPPQLSIPEVPLLSVAVPSSLLSVPPSALGGRVSPTPFFHHGQGGNGVNPTLLSGDVKASAASRPVVSPSVVFLLSSFTSSGKKNKRSVVVMSACVSLLISCTATQKWPSSFFFPLFAHL